MFGVQVVSHLGGRLNQHWLVESGGQRFVLRRWPPEWAATIGYETDLLAQLAAFGWPVPRLVAEPIECDGHAWSMAVFLGGEPPAQDAPSLEQRARGRLLAQLHGDMARLQGLGRRGSWRRCEEILEDSALDIVLAQHEPQYPDAIRILRWHLDRARERIDGLGLFERPGMVIHGDFTTWNLRFESGRLSGILDFELARFDHRVGDFALSWRGKYDEVVYGYNEVLPLPDLEWELLTPMWWAFLIEEACAALRNGLGVDEWSIRKLLQRSPLMGADKGDFRG